MNRLQRRALARADRKGGQTGFVDLSPPSRPILDRRQQQATVAAGKGLFALASKTAAKGEHCFSLPDGRRDNK